MQNAKGAPHLLNPFADFFCVPKRNSAKEKGTAARGLSGEFLAPALPDAAVARVESRCARRLSVDAFIHLFTEAYKNIDR